MEDAALGVGRFLRERELRAFFVEFRAPEDELPYPRGALFNERAHGLAQAEPVTGPNGVIEVDRDLVLVREHHGDAALGVFAAALGRRVLGHHEDLAVLRQFDGCAETGHTPADDEEVGFYVFFSEGHSVIADFGLRISDSKRLLI